MNSLTIRRWSKKAQEILREKGVEIDIQHTRYTPDCAVLNIATDGTKAYDQFLSKKEFIEAVKDGKCISGVEELSPDDYWKVISATNGFTRVALKFPDGNEIVGKYNYGTTGHFFKALGVSNAIKKALGRAKMNDLYSELMKEKSDVATDSPSPE